VEQKLDIKFLAAPIKN